MTLFQAIVSVVYVATMLTLYGPLPSISDSIYELPKKHSWLFTAFVWALALPMCFYGNGWYFMCGACVCFTGAALWFKRNGITREVHYWGVVLGVAFAFIGLVNDHLWYLVALAVVACVPFRKHKCAVLIAECIVIAVILTGLFIRNSNAV